jgi:hypothetical protein
MVCTKPMDKVPNALCNYGITNKKVLSFIEEVLQNYKEEF